MKILLIQPPFTIFKTEVKKCHPPLGLAYLAAVLKDSHQVLVLDALAEGYEEERRIGNEYLRYGLSIEKIGKRISDFSPHVVGISSLFSAQSENVHQICQIVKGIDKKIITILGGAHPSSVPEEVFKDKNVDFVVIGEGENVLKILLDGLENKKDIRDLEGIGFRHSNSLKINCRKNYEEDLDKFPFPYWDIFPMEKYFKINNPHGGQARRTPFLPLISSRGCPFECIFCSIHNLWGRNYRKRSAKNVLSEIEYLINKFRIKEILFEDDNLTLNKNRAKYIFQGILERQFDLVWSVPNGIAVQTLDDELLELMKKSGCYRISIGIESGDEYVLKNIIKKPIVLSQVKPMIDKARSLKMETVVFFVVGFPGESRKHLYNTLKFARRLGADNTNFFFATPLPGTRLFRLYKELNLINSEIDYSCLKSDYPSFSTEYFSKNELNAIISRQQMIMHLLFLFRHPFAFFQKLFLKLKFNRRYFIRYRMQFQRKRDRKTNTNTIAGDTSRKYDFL